MDTNIADKEYICGDLVSELRDGDSLSARVDASDLIESVAIKCAALDGMVYDELSPSGDGGVNRKKYRKEAVRTIAALSPSRLSANEGGVTRPETWMLEPAAIYLEMVEDDETGSNFVVAKFLRDLAALTTKPEVKGDELRFPHSGMTISEAVDFLGRHVSPTPASGEQMEVVENPINDAHQQLYWLKAQLSLLTEQADPSVVPNLKHMAELMGVTLDAAQKAIAEVRAARDNLLIHCDKSAEHIEHWQSRAEAAEARIERLETALNPFALENCRFDFSRWDEETKIEIHLPRSSPSKTIPVVWVNVEHILAARAALRPEGGQTDEA